MPELDGMTVAETAKRMGISKEAVRHRIDRETLRAAKAQDGTWRVLPDDEHLPRDHATGTMTDGMTGTTPQAADLYHGVAGREGRPHRASWPIN